MGWVGYTRRTHLPITGDSSCSRSSFDPNQVLIVRARLQEITDSLNQALLEAVNLERQKLKPSPGLRAQIQRLRVRQQAFREALEMWRTVLEVYPNYDR